LLCGVVADQVQKLLAKLIAVARALAADVWNCQQSGQLPLPAVYPYHGIVDEGGLAFYGIDFNEQCNGAATYVDRILRGAKASDLPIQAPTKFELEINLKVANVLGLTIPSSMIMRADEVIE
jgi:putative ABC transport system substrate-binding protein